MLFNPSNTLFIVIILTGIVELSNLKLCHKKFQRRKPADDRYYNVE